MLKTIALMLLIRFVASQDPAANTTTPTSGNSTTPLVDPTATTSSQSDYANNKCIMPTPFPVNVQTDLDDLVAKKINSMRKSLASIRDANKGACELQPLVAEADLEKSATFVGLGCPLPESKDRFVEFKHTGTLAQITWFSESKGSTDLTLPPFEQLTETIKSIKDEDYNKIIKNYTSGPWDAAFQIFWDKTSIFGCSLVKFNNSDFNWLSNIFQKPIKEMMVLQNFVCHFFPPGSRPEEQPWVYTCVPPISTTPLPKPHPITPPPMSSIRNVGHENGVNFKIFALFHAFIEIMIEIQVHNIILY